MRRILVPVMLIAANAAQASTKASSDAAIWWITGLAVLLGLGVATWAIVGAQRAGDPQPNQKRNKIF